MSRVNRRRSAVNFQFTISETQEVTLADVRVKVQNPVVRIRYNETAPFQSVGLAFAALPDLSSRENVSIHTLDYYPPANQPGIFTEEFYMVPSFFTEVGKFNITDIFIKKGTGLDVPLYFEHQITITTDLFIQSGSDIRVLDRNFDPVDPGDYLVWEGPNYWSVFHNLKHEYDGLTGDYAAYYVSYPLWDSTRITQREYVELLRPTPRFRIANSEDYLADLVSLPDDETLYEVQAAGDRFQVHIYYDIVDESPMNDIYVSPTPYVYAYRPAVLHEIGPLFPAALSQEDPWFPLLTNGDFFASNNEYLIAEYSQQPFMPHEPYKREIYDETIILERTLIKIQKDNLYVDALAGFHLELLIFDRDENIKWAGSTDTTLEFYVDAVGEETSIPYEHEGFESINNEDGLVQINYSLVELDDIILANYYYIEEDFAYTQTNMNPIYIPEMAQKSVIMFVVPYVGQNVTVYHLILDEEDKVEDSNAVPGAVAVPGGGNISHGSVLVNRGYTGSVDATWYIEITQSNSTPGDITDAQYRYKKGFTGGWTAATSMITDWVTLDSGVQIKFEPGTGGQDFYGGDLGPPVISGDTWTIEIESNDVGLTDDIFGMAFDDFLDTYCLPGPDDWENITAYIVDDKVSHMGVLYNCILGHTNQEPPNATYWEVFVSSELLVVARYAIGSNRGIQDLELVDTRVRGGGIDPDQLVEARLAFSDINWMFDIGHYDGYPFPGSASMLIDLPASLLKINGGTFGKEEIDSIVKHHLSFGVYPVVRFYCTNTGLVSHETVPDETYVDNWVVPDDAKCPTLDGEVICQSEVLTSTSSTTSTTSTSSTTSTTATASTTSSTASTVSSTSTTSSTATASTTSSTASSTSSTSSTSTTATASTTSSSSSSTTTTCPYEWESIHNDLYWEDAGEPIPLIWDGPNVWWETGGGGADAGLQPIGPWSVGLRAAAIRITHVGTGTILWTILDTDGATIGSDPAYLSGDPIPLTFGAFDIGKILIDDIDSDLKIQNIELLLCRYSTTSSTTTTSSTASTSSTTSTAPFLPFMVPASDGPSGTPLDPLTLQWLPNPPGPHFSTVNNHYRTPNDSTRDQAGLDPSVEQLVMGPVSVPGIYNTADITIRMRPNGVVGDVIFVVLYDSGGVPIAGPWPLFNSFKGYENLSTGPLLLTGGPFADFLLTGGVIEMYPHPSNIGTINVTEVTVELA